MKEVKEETAIHWGRFVLLGAIALILCFILPLSLFVPIPLTFAILLHGRLRGVLLGLATLMFGLLISEAGWFPSYGMGLFALSLLYGVVLSETFFRKIHPASALMRSGLGLVAGGAILLFFFSHFTEFSLKLEIERGVADMMATLKKENANLMPKDEGDARQLQMWMENPKILAQNIYHWMPAGLFVSVFFVLWANLFLILRNSALWKSNIGYPYGVRDLTRFRVPDYFVWALILSLLLALGGEALLGEKWQIWGVNGLYCVGIFYFFQGFGVYLDFLSSLKIMGLFRSLFIILTVLMASKIIALVGVFDHWINFRKFFKNKKKEM